MKQNMNRRALLKSAAMAIGSLGASRALANLCTPVTPSQPEGPFYPTQNQLDKDFDMTRIEGSDQVALGEQVYIKGVVTDENCYPVEGVLVDLWQACHTGKYKHERDPNQAELDPNFQYWAQVLTDENGEWGVKTIIPGAYPASAGWVRPPHIHFKVSKKAYRSLTTQMYFDDERFKELNKKDFLLQELSPEEQKALLVKFNESVGRLNISIQKIG